MALTPPARSETYRLAKAVGVLAVMASAVSQEYASGINFVATQSLGVYPLVEGLVPLAMFVTGFLLLPKVVLYMRFSRYMPRAGSAYVWIGRTLSLPVSFVVNFLWWVGLTSAVGVIAFTFGTFLGDALLAAGWTSGGNAVLTTLGHIVIGLAAIWTVYWIHTRGIGTFGALVQILFALVVVTALLIVGYGLLTPSSHFLTAASAASGMPLVAPKTSPPPSFGQFVSTCTLFVFAYGGLNSAPTLGGEAVEAGKTVPRGIFLAWITAILLFSAVSLAVFNVAPWWALGTLIAHGGSAYATTPAVIGLVAPHAVGVVLDLIVAVVVGKTLLPQLMATSRLAFAWAEDGLFGETFVKTSERRTPNAALFLVALIGSVFCVESSTVAWSVGTIIRSFSILAVLGVLAIGLLVAKWSPRFKDVEWAQKITAGWGIVVAAVAALVVAVLLVSSVLVVPNTSFVFQPIFQVAVAVLLGMALYRVAKQRGERSGRPLRAIITELPLE